MLYIKKQRSWYEATSDRMFAFDLCGKQISCGEEPIESFVEAIDFSQLDWTDTDVLSNDFKTGWIDRDGRFYGCSRRLHYCQAIYIHHCDDEELIDKGWVRVTAQGGPVIFFNHINELQVTTLHSLGYTDEQIYEYS